MKKLLLTSISALILLSSCDVANEIAQTVLNSDELDIDAGLKQALTTGFEVASDSASTSGAYWSDSVSSATTTRLSPVEENALNWVRGKAIQIALPDEAQQVFSHLETYKAWRSNQVVAIVLDVWQNPLEQKVNSLANSKEEIWQSINKAAETAAPASKTEFVNAITSMSLADGKAILFPNNGETEEALLKDSTSATSYLHETTREGLTAIYTPIIDSALNTVNATQLWSNFVNGYSDYTAEYKALHSRVTNLNAFTLGSYLLNAGFPQTRASVEESLALIKEGLADPSTLPELEPSLGKHTTEKGLDGLFHLVGGEEIKIRRDPLSYVTKFAAGTKQLIVDVFSSKETE